MLSADESRVAAAFSASDDMTWETAAHATDLPASFGERVRRNLRRLGRPFAARRGSLNPSPSGAASCPCRRSRCCWSPAPRSPGFRLPTERMSDSYGWSPDIAERGFRELRTA